MGRERPRIGPRRGSGSSRLGRVLVVEVLGVGLRSAHVLCSIGALTPRCGRRNGVLGLAGVTLGPRAVLMRALDRRLEVTQRHGEVRAGELLKRLGAVVFVRGPATRMRPLALGDHQPRGVLLGGDDDQRTAVERAFLVLMTVITLFERSNVLVSPCTAVRRSMERARKDAVRKKRSKSRGQARLGPRVVSCRLTAAVSPSSTALLRLLKSSRSRSALPTRRGDAEAAVTLRALSELVPKQSRG